MAANEPSSGPHESLADTVYARVKHDIAEFRLVPGDRFTEGEIATRLGVSRTPVRQALFRLQREGFVQVQFRAGWLVQPFDFEEFENLYDLRIVLETTAVQRLCEAALGRVDRTRLNSTFAVAKSRPQVVISTRSSVRARPAAGRAARNARIASMP